MARIPLVGGATGVVLTTGRGAAFRFLGWHFAALHLSRNVPSDERGTEMPRAASAATNGRVEKTDTEKLSAYMATTLRLAQQLARMKQPLLSRDLIRVAAGIGAAAEEI